ncbi:DNA endonuclease [Cyanophage S-RIM50]|jgi:hypothetical protein|uniref:Prolyl 4-hydroxylase alpha subunit domain-containing protein n=1 Tax=Cyanophage S-RIM50 TaxID=687803 RepID=A0A127KLH9_9CAUD|nr:DNA endonuclease [Cyanophage S-RIM50]AMO42811.1 hypothetical protein R290704_029 [Cyanophage S-RIM50]
MKSIYIEHDFLSEDECNAIIAFYEAFSHKSFHYRDNNSFPIGLKDFSELDEIHDRVLNRVAKIGQKKYVLDNHEVVKWPPKSKMSMHKDFDYDEWSAIVYLNNNYFGGRTLFENGIEVKPQKGTLIAFNGCNLSHGVSEILNGDRYTLAYWIKEHE